MHQIIDIDTEKHCLDTIGLFKNKMEHNTTSNDIDGEKIMDEEEWEEAKDIFFMVRVPFEVELTEESREKFSKAIMKRHRKRGRYGPQGGLPVN